MTDTLSWLCSPSMTMHAWLTYVHVPTGQQQELASSSIPAITGICPFPSEWGGMDSLEIYNDTYMQGINLAIEKCNILHTHYSHLHTSIKSTHHMVIDSYIPFTYNVCAYSSEPFSVWIHSFSTCRLSCLTQATNSLLLLKVWKSQQTCSAVPPSTNPRGLVRFERVVCQKDSSGHS